MNTSRLNLSLAITCLVLATLACTLTGSTESNIETPAADMNFSVADLGGDWSLVEEQGVGEMADIGEEDVLDANTRMFASEENTGLIMSIVLSTESVAAAKQEMQGDSIQDLGASMGAELPGAGLELLDPPDVGEEAVAVGGAYADLDMSVYMIAFRKANVIVMFSLMGSESSVDETLLVDYARQLEAKIE